MEAVENDIDRNDSVLPLLIIGPIQYEDNYIQAKHQSSLWLIFQREILMCIFLPEYWRVKESPRKSYYLLYVCIIFIMQYLKN